METRYISGKLKKRVLERDGYRCRYCGNNEGPFHMDHVYPYSKGGETSYENLVTSCSPCNLKKSNGVGMWPMSLEEINKISQLVSIEKFEKEELFKKLKRTTDSKKRILQSAKSAKKEADELSRRLNRTSPGTVEILIIFGMIACFPIVLNYFFDLAIGPGFRIMLILFSMLAFLAGTIIHLTWEAKK